MSIAELKAMYPTVSIRNQDNGEDPFEEILEAYPLKIAIPKKAEKPLRMSGYPTKRGFSVSFVYACDAMDEADIKAITNHVLRGGKHA